MLNKEECEKALEILNYVGDYKDGTPALLENTEPLAYGVIRQLIKEHFELLEVLIDCGFGELTPKGLKVVIEAGQYSSKKLNELRNPQPYKFEELKKGMWVWDNKGLYCFKCNPAISTDMAQCVTYSHFWINCGDEEDEFFEEYDEFEEGRFFPITKALEYQRKEDEK